MDPIYPGVGRLEGLAETQSPYPPANGGRRIEGATAGSLQLLWGDRQRDGTGRLLDCGAKALVRAAQSPQPAANP